MKKIAAGTFSMSASKVGNKLEGLDRKYMSVQTRESQHIRKIILGARRGSFQVDLASMSRVKGEASIVKPLRITNQCAI